MAKINQLPSGSYNTLVYDFTDPNGKRHYKSITAPSRKEVKLLVAEFLASRETEKKSNIAMTVGEAIDAYLESTKKSLAPTSRRTYISMRRSAFQEIMDVPINKLTSTMFQTAIDNYGKNHAPKTTKERYSFIKKCIKIQFKDADYDIKLPRPKKSKVVIPTKNEVMKLLECAKGTDVEIPLCLLALCGMRPCEISALEVDDIDFEKGTAYIHQEYVRDEFNKPLIQDNTKTLAGTRTIKLFKPALELIKPLKGKQKFVTDLLPDYIYRRHEKIVRQNKLKYYKPYLLRHYCVSVMLRMHVPQNYVAAYVGHDGEEMVKKIYGHIMEDQQADVFEGVEVFYSNFHNEMQNEIQNEK